MQSSSWKRGITVLELKICHWLTLIFTKSVGLVLALSNGLFSVSDGNAEGNQHLIGDGEMV